MGLFLLIGLQRMKQDIEKVKNTSEELRKRREISRVRRELIVKYKAKGYKMTA